MLWKKEQRERRYKFLYEKTYRFFYNLYKQEISTDVVDLPLFHYYKTAKDRATLSTQRFMAKVMLSGNLNREYAKAIRV